VIGLHLTRNRTKAKLKCNYKAKIPGTALPAPSVIRILSRPSRRNSFSAAHASLREEHRISMLAPSRGSLASTTMFTTITKGRISHQGQEQRRIKPTLW
jgi:hypothetical protein